MLLDITHNAVRLPTDSGGKKETLYLKKAMQRHFSSLLFLAHFLPDLHTLIKPSC